MFLLGFCVECALCLAFVFVSWVDYALMMVVLPLLILIELLLVLVLIFG